MAQLLDIYDLFIAFKSEANVNQGAYVSPLKFQALCNTISQELIQEKFAKWQESQKLTDDMVHLLKTVNLTIPQLAGKPYDMVTMPADFAHFSSARVVYNTEKMKGCVTTEYGCVDGGTGCPCETTECTADNKYIDSDMVALQAMERDEHLVEGMVTIVDNQRWASKLTHRTKMPTWKAPAITEAAGGWKIAPKNLGVMLLDYFLVPENAVFAYTINPATDEITYDVANSKPVPWPITMKAEFVARLIKKYGVAIGDRNLEMAGERDRVITNK